MKVLALETLPDALKPFERSVTPAPIACENISNACGRPLASDAELLDLLNDWNLVSRAEIHRDPDHNITFLKVYRR
jgi:hypothetical protein